LKVFSFFLALGCAKISYNPQKSKVYTFSADPNWMRSFDVNFIVFEI
jgi:hypothetical protein